MFIACFGQAMAASVEDIPTLVRVGRRMEPVFMGGSLWCTLSVGENYFAAPHQVSR